MKGETLEKPPPLLLPPHKYKYREKCLEEKAVQKFTARYDAFQGILKRVSEMKLSGSLDSEEPSTGSEKSESLRSEKVKPSIRRGASSFDARSNLSAFEDESSASSITSSDNCPHCPPYEEIPRVDCGSLTLSTSEHPAYAESEIPSFRNDFPSPPTPTSTEIHAFDRNSTAEEYKRREVTRRKSSSEFRRPRSAIAAPDRDWAKPDGRAVSFEGEDVPEGISEMERHQVEMFFKSLKTEVFVCGSLANLYFGWKEDEGNWTYRHTGIVVVVFDSEDTRSRSKRKIQILLSERGTCFPLWRDTIDNLSAYRQSGTGFHTMHLSLDHRRMAGLSFDCPSEAEKLLAHLENLTSNPENINISVPGSKKKKAPSKKRPVSLPQKKFISNPCLFQHVTSVAAKDRPMYMSLQTLIDGEKVKKIENIS